jgi:hypothetical protein
MEYFENGTEATFRLQLAWLSWTVYKPDERDLPPGWTSLALIESSDGFRAQVFEADKGYQVMAICGAQDETDFWDCHSIYKHEIPTQFLSLAKALETWSDVPLLVGHSLGGVLAKLGSLLLAPNKDAVAFNAPGVGKSVSQYETTASHNRITNFLISNDFLGCYGTHLGRTRVLPEVALGEDVFASHRAWRVLATGEPLEDQRPDFDGCIRRLEQEYPESVVVRHLLESGLVDLVTLAKLVQPGGFAEGLQCMAEGILGPELARSRVGRLIRAQLRVQ